MRILHTMIRVGDLDRSLAFYTEVLGMQLLRRRDYPVLQGGVLLLGLVVMTVNLLVSSSRQLSNVAVSDWLAKLMGYSFFKSAPM